MKRMETENEHLNEEKLELQEKVIKLDGRIKLA